jgi:hypothetical protein
MNRAGRWLFIAPLALIGMVLFALLGGQVVKLLWNWLMPPLFAWRPITFWQALGLLALCRILFGGFGIHGGPRSRMNAEMRDRFRRRMRERFGFHDAPHPGAGPTESI